MCLKAIDVTARLIIVLRQNLTQHEMPWGQILCSCRSKFPLFPAVLDQLNDPGSAIVSVIASQFAHTVSPGLTPAHRAGAEAIGKHVAYMTFGTAAINEFISKRSPHRCPIAENIPSQVLDLIRRLC